MGYKMKRMVPIKVDRLRVFKERWPDRGVNLEKESAELEGWKAAKKERMRRWVYSVGGDIRDITSSDSFEGPTPKKSDEVRLTVFNVYYTVNGMRDANVRYSQKIKAEF